MPSGKTHDKYWRKFLPYALGSSILVFVFLELTLSYMFPYTCTEIGCFSNSLVIAVGFPLGYLYGRYAPPDLDQANITTSEWKAMAELPLGDFYVAYWLPYGRRFTHRGFWSHSYFVSTFVRVIYQFMWFPAVHAPRILYVLLVGVFLGLSVSDAIHIYLDVNHEEDKNGNLVRRTEKCRKNSFANYIKRTKSKWNNVKKRYGKIVSKFRR